MFRQARRAGAWAYLKMPPITKAKEITTPAKSNPATTFLLRALPLEGGGLRDCRRESNLEDRNLTRSVDAGLGTLPGPRLMLVARNATRFKAQSRIFESAYGTYELAGNPTTPVTPMHKGRRTGDPRVALSCTRPAPF